MSMEWGEIRWTMVRTTAIGLSTPSMRSVRSRPAIVRTVRRSENRPPMRSVRTLPLMFLLSTTVIPPGPIATAKALQMDGAY
jgi:hypothetical protein